MMLEAGGRIPLWWLPSFLKALFWKERHREAGRIVESIIAVSGQQNP